jgi:hypothetical protein
MWETIAADAVRESALWADALLPEDARTYEPVFSPLGPETHALGVETIYEGYLVHFGRSRLFAPADEETALLLGDYLYAHGLVRIAETGDIAAVADLAELISLCSMARAENRDGDGEAWAATAARLGMGELEPARDTLRLHGDVGELDAVARDAAGAEAVGQALAAHARLVL